MTRFVAWGVATTWAVAAAVAMDLTPIAVAIMIGPHITNLSVLFTAFSCLISAVAM